jgi:hypothetical protein
MPRGGFGWRRQQNEAESLVAPVSFAATRSEEAQLRGGLVKEDVGVVGHGCLPDTTFALVGETSKAKVLSSQTLAMERRGWGQERL